MHRPVPTEQGCTFSRCIGVDTLERAVGSAYYPIGHIVGFCPYAIIAGEYFVLEVLGLVCLHPGVIVAVSPVA